MSSTYKYMDSNTYFHDLRNDNELDVERVDNRFELSINLPVGEGYYVSMTRADLALFAAELLQLVQHGKRAVMPTCTVEGEAWKSPRFLPQEEICTGLVEKPGFETLCIDTVTDTYFGIDDGVGGSHKLSIMELDNEDFSLGVDVPVSSLAAVGGYFLAAASGFTPHEGATTIFVDPKTGNELSVRAERGELFEVSISTQRFSGCTSAVKVSVYDLIDSGKRLLSIAREANVAPAPLAFDLVSKGQQ